MNRYKKTGLLSPSIMQSNILMTLADNPPMSAKALTDTLNESFHLGLSAAVVGKNAQILADQHKVITGMINRVQYYAFNHQQTPIGQQIKQLLTLNGGEMLLTDLHKQMAYPFDTKALGWAVRRCDGIERRRTNRGAMIQLTKGDNQ